MVDNIINKRETPESPTIAKKKKKNQKTLKFLQKADKRTEVTKTVI